MAAIAEQQVQNVAGRRHLRIFLMYILPPLIAIGVIAIPLVSTVSVLPRIRVSPGFALMDQSGQLLTHEDLRGDVVVIGFASLECDGSCRASIEAMREAAGRYESSPDDEDRPGVRLMMIVVDPVEEPATLQAFAAEHDLVGKQWSVVSGNEAVLRAVVGSGFDVNLAGTADAVTHDPALFLTDHAGFLRAEYRTASPSASTITNDIDRVLTEATAGGLGGALYNAAHSFSLTCGG